MKIRIDFVTNSSSSSFLVSANSMKDLENATLKIKINLKDCIERNYDTKKPLVFKWAKDVLDFDADDDWKQKVLAELAKGNIVASIEVSSDDDNPILQFLYNVDDEEKNFGDNVKVIA